MAARILLLGVCAPLLVLVAIASATPGEPASSMVVGVAKCADCMRKNMNAEAVFKGVHVAVKCKNNVNGEYESKAIGKLDGSGAFSVPLATDLHVADCHAQLHSAAGKPCPGQEPSTIVPQSSDGTFIVIPGKKTNYQSAECASTTICGPIKKHIIEHFHKKPVTLKPTTPVYHPTTPMYHGPSTPIYHPPALKESDTFCDKIKKHFFDHFHKKQPVPEYKPAPEYHPPTPEYHPPTPEYHPPTSEYHPPTPEYHPPTPEYHPPTPEYHPPTPEYHPPTPEYHPTTPVYGQPKPTPIYHPPVKH